MSAPCEVFVRDIEAVGGQSCCFRVAVPARGDFHKVVCEQTGGVLAGFTLDIFNNETPVADCLNPPVAGSSSSSSSSSTPFTGEAIYKIMSTITVAGGGTAAELFTTGRAYRNTDLLGSTNIQEGLYVRIVPGGSGAKTFQFSILVSSHAW